MPVQKLKDFLDSQKVKYTTSSHSMAFTASEVAASAHVSGKEMAKTVMVKVDGKLAMVVLPAPEFVSMELLRDVTNADEVELATERDFKDQFPDCEIGAMPPFGNLYDLETYVDASLTEDKEIAFNAGTHTEIIKMAYEDFHDLVQPKVVQLAFEV
ncbi:MAG: YbaK/EbsC family protein [Candidatus Marinimicrobia bacterium]|nr:YbaK/EbsC family protein [Candidatus Neomarinimicrobiota bacterium]